MKTTLWILTIALGLGAQPLYAQKGSGSSFSYGNTPVNSGSYGNGPVNSGSYGNTPINAGSYGNPGSPNQGGLAPYNYAPWGYGYGYGFNSGYGAYTYGYNPYADPSLTGGLPGSSFPGLMMTAPYQGATGSRAAAAAAASAGDGYGSMRGMKPYNIRRSSGSTSNIARSNPGGARNNNLNDFLGMGGGGLSYGAVAKPRNYKPLAIPGNASSNGNATGNVNAIQRQPLPGVIDKVPERNPDAYKNSIDISRITNINNSSLKKPSWINDQNQSAAVQKGMQGQMVKMSTWKKDHPDRDNHWNDWGDDVRYKWRWHNLHDRWYNGDWWYHHGHGIGHWHYYNQFNYYPWGYWWTYPTWATVGTWFNWNVPVIWGAPVFYDYGPGGNVVFQGNSVIFNGQNIGSPADFAQSAALLAATNPPNGNPDQAEWLPLGTFAVSTNESDLNPTRTLQLAVDKSGFIAGTLYNIQTDQAQYVQGQVDKNTQRVAFQFGDAPNVVAETGVYNLTQDAAPLLVHYGTDRVEVYNLIRLTAPEDR